MPSTFHRGEKLDKAAVTVSGQAESAKAHLWYKSKTEDVDFDELRRFWDQLADGERRSLLRLEKQSLFEQVRRNLYCSRCHGLLVEGFTQISLYGREGKGGITPGVGSGTPYLNGGPSGRAAGYLPDGRGLNGTYGLHELGRFDDSDDPSVQPWGGLAATKENTLTVLDCFVVGASLDVLQNVFECARQRERERELLYPNACGGGGRGWSLQGSGSAGGSHGQSSVVMGRMHTSKESCGLHTARLSCQALVDFWHALGDDTRKSLLCMKEEDFVERLVFRFESKRFCRDCRRNVLREFKELKELKRMRRDPRCSLAFCAPDTAFRYEVTDHSVAADWHDCFLGSGESSNLYQRFEWGVGTADGKGDIVPFQDVGPTETVHLDGLDLAGYATCHVTVRGWRRDGRSLELGVKATALGGQLCVHRRLAVGDGQVAINKGVSIQGFFERAEEAEAEEDSWAQEEEVSDKDGGGAEMDGGDGGDGAGGTGSGRAQKHAKSPELARDFLLDAAMVIFKKAVEKAFREGTARQNAHSLFVGLALGLLEERLRVACKAISALEKQNKLMEEEEEEKREEEERKERRRQKEREKKLRRKEKVKAKGDREAERAVDKAQQEQQSLAQEEKHDGGEEDLGPHSGHEASGKEVGQSGEVSVTETLTHGVSELNFADSAREGIGGTDSEEEEKRFASLTSANGTGLPSGSMQELLGTADPGYVGEAERVGDGRSLLTVSRVSSDRWQQELDQTAVFVHGAEHQQAAAAGGTEGLGGMPALQAAVRSSSQKQLPVRKCMRNSTAPMVLATVPGLARAAARISEDVSVREGPRPKQHQKPPSPGANLALQPKKMFEKDVSSGNRKILGVSGRSSGGAGENSGHSTPPPKTPEQGSCCSSPGSEASASSNYSGSGPSHQGGGPNRTNGEESPAWGPKGAWQLDAGSEHGPPGSAVVVPPAPANGRLLPPGSGTSTVTQIEAPGGGNSIPRVAARAATPNGAAPPVPNSPVKPRSATALSPMPHRNSGGSSQAEARQATLLPGRDTTTAGAPRIPADVSAALQRPGSPNRQSEPAISKNRPLAPASNSPSHHAGGSHHMGGAGKGVTVSSYASTAEGGSDFQGATLWRGGRPRAQKNLKPSESFEANQQAATVNASVVVQGSDETTPSASSAGWSSSGPNVPASSVSASSLPPGGGQSQHAHPLGSRGRQTFPRGPALPSNPAGSTVSSSVIHPHYTQAAALPAGLPRPTHDGASQQQHGSTTAGPPQTEQRPGSFSNGFGAGLIPRPHGPPFFPSPVGQQGPPPSVPPQLYPYAGHQSSHPPQGLPPLGSSADVHPHYFAPTLSSSPINSRNHAPQPLPGTFFSRRPQWPGRHGFPINQPLFYPSVPAPQGNFSPLPLLSPAPGISAHLPPMPPSHAGTAPLPALLQGPHKGSNTSLAGTSAGMPLLPSPPFFSDQQALLPEGLTLGVGRGASRDGPAPPASKGETNHSPVGEGDAFFPRPNGTMVSDPSGRDESGSAQLSREGEGVGAPSGDDVADAEAGARAPACDGDESHGHFQGFSFFHFRGVNLAEEPSGTSTLQPAGDSHKQEMPSASHDSQLSGLANSLPPSTEVAPGEYSLFSSGAGKQFGFF